MPLGTLALILLIAGAILFLIAWIGALILTARLGRWGWFAAIFFFTLIGLLAYSLVGPETPASSPQSLQS
uniref:Cardiolipin synthase N-terminal domain-containing protein n=1 Tax=Thermogemmatispora argillosa TaxID=2045280 RepID=A0A455SZA8_9CHLR|nr:hypothetical protein KTA_18860 [Thermogemmatispora argillosa]